MSSYSDTDAWAVGGHGFAHWDGREWRDVPASEGGGRVDAIADAGPSDAWAVGRLDVPPRGKNFATRIQHWDGVSWNITPSPEFRGRFAALWSVAAFAPDDAWAVGCDGQAALVEHWDGEGWSRVAVPVPGPGIHSRLTAISGRSSNDIWAIGDHDNTAPTPNSLFALHYDGTEWRAVPVDQVAGHSSSLWSVTAISADDVWAVGRTIGIDGKGGALTEHWDGQRWQIVPSPFDQPTSTTTGSLLRVTARAPDDVWAGGATYTPDGVGYEVLLVHWDGVRWTQDTTAQTTPGSGNSITGISTTLGGHVIWATNAGRPTLFSHA
ncbi:hypothetical protein [Actinomadura litoris]|uniref:hypothetical protein n=1 Tax=Actinomadura litoris TaxID=2678616 RepID=UPI001FA7B4AF|nr:hypothetical protein [Actinomadura litoris]